MFVSVGACDDEADCLDNGNDGRRIILLLSAECLKISFQRSTEVYLLKQLVFRFSTSVCARVCLCGCMHVRIVITFRSMTACTVHSA